MSFVESLSVEFLMTTFFIVMTSHVYLMGFHLDLTSTDATHHLPQYRKYLPTYGTYLYYVEVVTSYLLPRYFIYVMYPPYHPRVHTYHLPAYLDVVLINKYSSVHSNLVQIWRRNTQQK